MVTYVRASSSNDYFKLILNCVCHFFPNRYVSEFLSVKDTYTPAHKLLGHILAKLLDTEKAIVALKRCLELDDRQKDVLLMLCQLYCQTDIDPDRARVRRISVAAFIFQQLLERKSCDWVISISNTLGVVKGGPEYSKMSSIAFFHNYNQ